jgi:hypothetical protein
VKARPGRSGLFTVWTRIASPAHNSRPADDGRPHQSELWPLLVEEAEPNVSEKDMVHAVPLFNSDPLSFESVANGHQGTLPSNAPARSDFANSVIRWVLDGAQTARELSMGSRIERRRCPVIDTFMGPLLIELDLKGIEASLLGASG